MSVARLRFALRWARGQIAFLYLLTILHAKQQITKFVHIDAIFDMPNRNTVNMAPMFIFLWLWGHGGPVRQEKYHGLYSFIYDAMRCRLMMTSPLTKVLNDLAPMLATNPHSRNMLLIPKLSMDGMCMRVVGVRFALQ